jgi:putative ABC transport system permease protein
VRLAVGASRWRVIRLLLTESFLLAVAGGANGILLARWSVELLFPWVFARSSGRIFAKTALSLSLDWRVMAFAMSMSLLSSVAFGLAPALRATRQDLIPAINGGHLAFGGRIARSWLRNGLVVAQVALCFVLLIPAGLLLRALTKVGGADRGFAANKLLVVEYSVNLVKKDAPSAQLFRQQLMARLAALPGVQSVCPQADSDGQARIILLDNRGQKAPGKQFDQVPFQWVMANYLDTIGTPLILGRGFTVEEVESKIPVIIVSQSTARNLWPDENPLDKTMSVEQLIGDGSVCKIMPVAKVIGVRMTLGARAGHVQMLVIAQGMKLVLIGVLIGVPLSMAASQVVKSMLFGLSTRDPATYGAVALLLAIAGLMACWIPARRAAKVNPMIALRFE